MKSLYITFGLLFIFYSQIAHSSVATLLERTDEPKYNLQFLDPSEPLPVTKGVEVFITRPINKQKYKCILPPDSMDNNESTEEEQPLPKVRDFLEPLASACLYRLAGWWTYEFCYGKHIRQYHQEKDLPIRPQDEFYLGKQTEADRLKLLEQTEEKDETKEYFSEMYTHGTVCDINGQQRSTEIRYYCSNDKSTTMISDIKEPFSCNYVISIATPLICKHPKFAPKRELLSHIYCVPIGDIKEKVPDVDWLGEEPVVPKQTQETTQQVATENGAQDPAMAIVEEVIQQFVKADLHSVTELEREFIETVKHHLSQATEEDDKDEVDEQQLVEEERLAEPQAKKIKKSTVEQL